jgi:exoribonuclease R
VPIKRVWAPRIDFSVLRRELKLPGEFPPEALAEAESAARERPLPPTDLTGVPFVTIDPATSRDLDQALHLSRAGSGYRVRYAIADVASYVRPGGPLEAETWVRGQTVYLPDGKVPLHPPVLSEDAVSLFPDVDRAAVVWTIEVDADGALGDVRLERATVRSRAKLDYPGVQAELDKGTAAEAYALLPELGTLLARRAAGRGAVNLPLPEQEIEPDGDGWRLVLRAPLPVEEHNAQVSLLTGMAAARLMLAGGIGLLRTMPAPRPEAVDRLRAAARSLGIAWPRGGSVGAVVAAVDPGDPRGAAFLDQAAELLRGAGYTAFDDAAPPAGNGPAQHGNDTAQRASGGQGTSGGQGATGGQSARGGQNASGGQGTSGGQGASGGLPGETGHGGVGAPYAHVTAPLRRLADRYATEVCLALHEGRPVPEWARAALPQLPKAMAATDRVASAAERGAIALAEAVVLAGRVGEVFDAGVLDVDDHPKKGPGGSIALDDPAVLARCRGDLPLGERIRARLTTADPATRTVEFERV